MVEQPLSTKYLKPSVAAEKAGLSEIVLGWTDRVRYYSVITGTAVVEWPAWQFDPAVNNADLEQVLSELTKHPKALLHTFFVSGDDSLNELSPAEMLAGKTFSPRTARHASQIRMLHYPIETRRQRVLTIAKLYVADLMYRN